ncbi:MAG: sigma-70 family RNA polymerase sigma factor [Verrucomicrobiae bacterium]|nr:sigma-70 family RNA polymerase sigma factor [Verrucomicrobiae bacterium]
MNPQPLLHAIAEKSELERLFRDAADDLTRYFTRRHRGGCEAPQDLVQETFLEMTRGLERGGEPRSLRAYLFGVARHVSCAAWKRRDREKVLSLEISSDPAGGPSTDDRVEAAREVIESLPRLQREILELRFTQQLSYAEIAEALAIPVGTVRSRLHHAIRLVRGRVEASSDETTSTRDNS